MIDIQGAELAVVVELVDVGGLVSNSQRLEVLVVMGYQVVVVAIPPDGLDVVVDWVLGIAVLPEVAVVVGDWVLVVAMPWVVAVVVGDWVVVVDVELPPAVVMEDVWVLVGVLTAVPPEVAVVVGDWVVVMDVELPPVVVMEDVWVLELSAVPPEVNVAVDGWVVVLSVLPPKVVESADWLVLLMLVVADCVVIVGAPEVVFGDWEVEAPVVTISGWVVAFTVLTEELELGAWVVLLFAPDVVFVGWEVELFIVTFAVVAAEVWPDTSTAGRSSPNRRRCRAPVKPGNLGNIVTKYIFNFSICFFIISGKMHLYNHNLSKWLIRDLC